MPKELEQTERAVKESEQVANVSRQVIRNLTSYLPVVSGCVAPIALKQGQGRPRLSLRCRSCLRNLSFASKTAFGICMHLFWLREPFSDSLQILAKWKCLIRQKTGCGIFINSSLFVGVYM